MATREKLDWSPVDTHGFKGKLREAYDAYKDAQAQANDARKAFEAVAAPLAAKKAPKGKEPVFSYRFGKVALAFRDETEGEKTSDDAISL